MNQITDPAVLLAMIRATGAVPAAAVDPRAAAAARRTVAAAGRLLVDCQVPPDGTGDLTRGRAAAGITLGWAAHATPSPRDTGGYATRQLAPVARLTWACCLGLAWPDRSDWPYPGRAFRRADVLELAAGLGATHAWVTAAMDHDLTPAGLLVHEGQSLRLGPAAVAMPEPFVEALRRVHERLPRRADDDRAGEGSSQ